MGRRANLPDHGVKVRKVWDRVSKADAETIWRKYGFCRMGFDFHGALNYALSWWDTFLDLEERPVNESLKILRAVHTVAKSLGAYLDKPGANKLLWVHHEDPVPDPLCAFVILLPTPRTFWLHWRQGARFGRRRQSDCDAISGMHVKDCALHSRIAGTWKYRSCLPTASSLRRPIFQMLSTG